MTPAEAAPVRGTPAGTAPAGTPGSGGVETGRWSVQVLREGAPFADLAAEWEDLYRRCPSATPFQSFAWLSSWWREYGAPGRLRLVLMRRDGRLVAAAPLLLRRRGPWRVLAPLGGELSDFHDVLVDESGSAETFCMLAEALAAEPGWDLLDLPEVPPEGAAHGLWAVWGGGRWRAAGSAGLQLPAGSVEEFLARLPKSSAKTARSKLRRIDRHGVQVHPVAAAEAAPAVRELLRLHGEQWRGRGINPEHLRPRFGRHLAAAASRMVALGQASLTRYEVDGRVVATDLDVIGASFVGTYLAGFDPRLRRHIDVALMMLAQALALTERQGRPLLHLLRGTEPYKQHWHPVQVRSHRLLLAHPRRHAAAGSCALAVRARTRLADALRDRVPWLRRARTRARQAAARLRRRQP